MQVSVHDFHLYFIFCICKCGKLLDVIMSVWVYGKTLEIKAALTSFEFGMDDFRTVQKPALKL